MNYTLLISGIVVLGISVVLYQQGRRARLPSMLLTVLGFALAVISLSPNILSVAVTFRMRLVMTLISILILFTTLEAVRRTHLKERYALLWVGTSLVFLALAIYPDLIAGLVALTGMHYISAIVVLVFTFILLVAFHMSLSLSRHEDARRRLAQQTALLETRISELENEVARLRDRADPSERPPPSRES